MVPLRWPPWREPIGDFGRHAPSAASASVSSTAAPRASLLPFGYSLPCALILTPTLPRTPSAPSGPIRTMIFGFYSTLRAFQKAFPHRMRRAERAAARRRRAPARLPRGPRFVRCYPPPDAGGAGSDARRPQRLIFFGG